MANTLVGKDDWLFLCEDSNHVCHQHMGKRRLSVPEVAQYRTMLDVIDERFKQLKIPYMLVAVPYKERIYHEYHPVDTLDANMTTCIDRIIDSAEYPHRYPILDLKHVLLNHKNTERLYRLNDTHWNMQGAFIAYGEIMRAMHHWGMIEVPPITQEDVTVTYQMTEGGDLCAPKTKKHMVGSEFATITPQPQDKPEKDPVITLNHAKAKEIPFPGEITTYGERPARAFTTGNPDLPTALIFRTSSTDSLIPFLSEHFNNSYYVWLSAMDFEIIEQVKPDIVLHIFEDRYLNYPPGFDPEGSLHKRVLFTPKAPEGQGEEVSGLIKNDRLKERGFVEFVLPEERSLMGQYGVFIESPSEGREPAVIYYDFGDGLSELSRHRFAVQKTFVATVEFKKPCRKVRVNILSREVAANADISFKKLAP